MFYLTFENLKLLDYLIEELSDLSKLRHTDTPENLGYEIKSRLIAIQKIKDLKTLNQKTENEVAKLEQKKYNTNE